MTPRNDNGSYGIGSDTWPGLAKLLEEMGELQQVLGKVMGSSGSLDHWDGNLRGALIDELGDVYAALNFFVTTNDLPADRVAVRRRYKQDIFAAWHIEGQDRHA